MEVINRVNIENLSKTELKLKRKNFILCVLIEKTQHKSIRYNITPAEIMLYYNISIVKRYYFQMSIKTNRVVSMVKQIVEELERC